eukprot:1573151-Pleurochrysis_carterae.AAC.2
MRHVESFPGPIKDVQQRDIKNLTQVFVRAIIQSAMIVHGSIDNMFNVLYQKTQLRPKPNNRLVAARAGMDSEHLEIALLVSNAISLALLRFVKHVISGVAAGRAAHISLAVYEPDHVLRGPSLACNQIPKQGQESKVKSGHRNACDNEYLPRPSPCHFQMENKIPHDSYVTIEMVMKFCVAVPHTICDLAVQRYLLTFVTLA